MSWPASFAGTDAAGPLLVGPGGSSSSSSSSSGAGDGSSSGTGGGGGAAGPSFHLLPQFDDLMSRTMPDAMQPAGSSSSSRGGAGGGSAAGGPAGGSRAGGAGANDEPSAGSQQQQGQRLRQVGSPGAATQSAGAGALSTGLSAGGPEDPLPEGSLDGMDWLTAGQGQGSSVAGRGSGASGGRVSLPAPLEDGGTGAYRDGAAGAVDTTPAGAGAAAMVPSSGTTSGAGPVQAQGSGTDAGSPVRPGERASSTSADVLQALYAMYNGEGSTGGGPSAQGAGYGDEYDSDSYASTSVDPDPAPLTTAGLAAGQPQQYHSALGQGQQQRSTSGSGARSGSGGSRGSSSVGNAGSGATGSAGGGGGGGNSTAGEVAPFCQPSLQQLCADRDLVTFLGVTTDQIVFAPSVLQWWNLAVVDQRGLAARARPQFQDQKWTSSLSATNNLRYSGNVLFQGFNGVASNALQLQGLQVDASSSGRVAPDSITRTFLAPTAKATFERVDYKPNRIITGTGPGFATTVTNFGPYGNFLLPGGLQALVNPNVRRLLLKRRRDAS